MHFEPCQGPDGISSDTSSFLSTSFSPPPPPSLLQDSLYWARLRLTSEKPSQPLGFPGGLRRCPTCELYLLWDRVVRAPACCGCREPCVLTASTSPAAGGLTHGGLGPETSQRITLSPRSSPLCRSQHLFLPGPSPNPQRWHHRPPGHPSLNPEHPLVGHPPPPSRSPGHQPRLCRLQQCPKAQPPAWCLPLLAQLRLSAPSPGSCLPPPLLPTSLSSTWASRGSVQKAHLTRTPLFRGSPGP